MQGRKKSRAKRKRNSAQLNSQDLSLGFWVEVSPAWVRKPRKRVWEQGWIQRSANTGQLIVSGLCDHGHWNLGGSPLAFLSSNNQHASWFCLCILIVSMCYHFRNACIRLWQPAFIASVKNSTDEVEHLICWASTFLSTKILRWDMRIMKRVSNTITWPSVDPSE